MLRSTAFGTASTFLLFSELRDKARAASGQGRVVGSQKEQPPTVTGNDFAQLPFWGDGARWDRPGYYKTIVAGRRMHPKTFHNADVNGDGRDELIGRGPGGLLINRFDPASGQWVVMAAPAFTDGRLLWREDYGWTNPSYYETIQCGDIDGDGRAELIGRGGQGIEIYKYDQSTDIATWHGFSPLPRDPKNPALGLWSDQGTDNVWGLPGHYPTIQCADVDHDGQDELIGRGLSGISIYKYDKSAGKWFELYGPQGNSFLWANGDHGWYPPQYSQTVQCADVDGDKAAELIGRGPQGIEIYKYDAVTKNLLPMPVPQRATGGAIWSDAAGWDKPQYYQTIQCADIDGDGQAELIGRGEHGVEVYKYDRSARTWKPLVSPVDPKKSSRGLWPDEIGWDRPEYYLTIQCADVDGDGRAELIGRGGKGVEVYHYDSSSQPPKWIPNLAFSSYINTTLAWDDPNGWNQVEFYTTIQTARGLLPGDAGYTGDGTHVQSVLLARGSVGMQTWRYDGSLSKAVPTSNPFPMFSELSALDKALRGSAATGNIREQYTNTTAKFNDWRQSMYSLPIPSYDTPASGRPHTSLPLPKGIRQDAWDAVTWQIYWEITWVENVNGWFDKLEDLLTKATIGKDLNLQDIGDKLSIAPDSSISVTLNSLGLAAAALAIVVAGPELPAAAPAAGCLGAIFRFIVPKLPGGGSAFEFAYNNLQQQLANNFTTALDENANLQIRVLTDYGLFKAIGEMIQNTSWSWPDDQTAKMVKRISRSYAISIWQALLATLPWTVYSSGLDGPPPSYPSRYIYKTSGEKKNWYWLVLDPLLTYFVPTSTLEDLFNAQQPDQIFPLGVPLADVYEGRNGWPRLRWECADRYASSAACEPPPGNSLLKSGFSSEPTLYPFVDLARDPNTNEILAAVTIYNQGLTAARNVEITDASLNGRQTVETDLQTVVQQGDPQTILLRFPDIPKDTSANFKISGIYLGGKFETSIRIDVPD